MNGDFGIIQRKFGRAQFHAEDFATKWTEFIHGQAYGFTVNLDAEPPHTDHFRWQVRTFTADE